MASLHLSFSTLPRFFGIIFNYFLDTFERLLYLALTNFDSIRNFGFLFIGCVKSDIYYWPVSKWLLLFRGEFAVTLHGLILSRANELHNPVGFIIFLKWLGTQISGQVDCDVRCSTKVLLLLRWMLWALILLLLSRLLGLILLQLGLSVCVITALAEWTLKPLLIVLAHLRLVSVWECFRSWCNWFDDFLLRLALWLLTFPLLLHLAGLEHLSSLEWLFL